MDARLQKFNVFAKIPIQYSLKRLDSTRRLEERSFLQLKQYKNEFIRTPSNSNTCQAQPKKLRIKIQPSESKNQILSYSLSIQNIETIPNRSLDPKVIKLIAPNHKKNTLSAQKEGIVTTRNHYNNYFAHHDSKENNGSLPSIRFQNKIVKSQFEANLQFYKKQKNIPIQVKLINQDEIRKQFEQTRNRFIKSYTDFEQKQESILISQAFRTSKSKFHLKEQRSNPKNNVNNNSVESQTNMDLEYLDDLQRYDHREITDEVIQNN